MLLVPLTKEEVDLPGYWLDLNTFKVYRSVDGKLMPYNKPRIDVQKEGTRFQTTVERIILETCKTMVRLVVAEQPEFFLGFDDELEKVVRTEEVLTNEGVISLQEDEEPTEARVIGPISALWAKEDAAEEITSTKPVFSRKEELQQKVTEYKEVLVEEDTPAKQFKRISDASLNPIEEEDDSPLPPGEFKTLIEGPFSEMTVDHVLDLLRELDAHDAYNSGIVDLMNSARNPKAFCIKAKRLYNRLTSE